MYANVDSIVGFPPVGFGNVAADTVQRLSQGMLFTVSDNWWGTAEVVWARAAGNIRPQGLCVLLPVFDSTLQAFRYDASEVPNTANLGRPLCVALGSLTAGQYGWFVVTGVVPVNSNGSVAADFAFGIAATGQAGNSTAGRQVLNARNAAPATTTVVKAGCSANAGSLTLTAPNTAGWFVGVYLSGTGLAAGTTVTAIDPSERLVTLSAATTGLVSGNVTATYNNGTVFYNVAHLNRAFAQGIIT